MLMELSKIGKFKLVQAAASNPGRCGAENNRDFAYELRVAVLSDWLDTEDFVFDHLLIQKYFDETYAKEPWVLSCELIGARTVYHFWQQLRGRKVMSIECNIIADGVNHRCLWDAEKEAQPIMPLIKSAAANVGNNWYTTSPGAVAGTAAIAPQP